MWRSIQIAIAHEGHQGADKTLARLRKTSWFRNMRKAVFEYVDTCNPGCTAANPHNATPTQQETPTPTEVWELLYADFKGTSTPSWTPTASIRCHTSPRALVSTPTEKSSMRSCRTLDHQKRSGRTMAHHTLGKNGRNGQRAGTSWPNTRWNTTHKRMEW